MNNPITVPLPADLPTNWQTGQTVTVDGTSAGYTEQHGYNYLMQQVNNAQTAAQEVGDVIPSCADLTLSNLTDPQQALANLGAGVRPNLLGNAYFVGGGTGWGVFPVNQRGKSSYTTQNASPVCIDRWRLGWNSSISLEDSGVVLSGDNLLFRFSQLLYDALYGKTITISLLTAAGALYTYSGVYTGSVGYTPIINVRINYSGAPGAVVIRLTGEPIAAVKLELGENQTLAYQIGDGTWVMLPQGLDYQQELAKCQVYYENSWFGVGLNVQNEFFGASFSPNTIDTRIPYKVTKRSNPTVTFYGNGVNAGWVIYYDGSYVDASNISVTNMNRGGLQAFVARLTLSGTTVGLHEAIQIQGHWEASAEL